MRFVLASFLLCTAVSVTHASDFTGYVSVRVQSSPTNAGQVRVSVQTVGTGGIPIATRTSCGWYWYSYDLPLGATSQMWAVGLIGSIDSAKKVHIAGSGTCDQYGIEKIAYFDFLP